MLLNLLWFYLLCDKLTIIPVFSLCLLQSILFSDISNSTGSIVHNVPQMQIKSISKKKRISANHGEVVHFSLLVTD